MLEKAEANVQVAWYVKIVGSKRRKGKSGNKVKKVNLERRVLHLAQLTSKENNFS